MDIEIKGKGMNNLRCNKADSCRSPECPHAIPHEEHQPRQTEWDGNVVCTVPDFCFSVTSTCRIHVDVISYEVNKDTNEKEDGTGWWHTEYPDYVLEENRKLKAMIAESEVQKG